MDKDFKVANGTFYNKNTPNAVISILEKARRDKTRVRLFYGDTFLGTDWLEQTDTLGYISRTCGSIKVPILLSRETASGGPAILTDAIVRITIDKKEVYRNPKYVLPTFEVCDNENVCNKDEYPYSVYSLDKKKVIVNCKTKEKAETMIAYIRGERNCR